MNPETHKCLTCGYEWKHGQDGSHDCAPILAARVRELKAEAEIFAKDLAVELGVVPHELFANAKKAAVRVRLLMEVREVMKAGLALEAQLSALRPRYPEKGELPEDDAPVIFETYDLAQRTGRYDATLGSEGGYFVSVEIRPEWSGTRRYTGHGMHHDAKVARWWPAPQAPEAGRESELDGGARVTAVAPDERSEGGLVARLSRLLEVGGAEPSIDPGRSIRNPCTFCGSAPRPGIGFALRTIGRYNSGGELTRPVCPKCEPLAAAEEEAAR